MWKRRVRTCLQKAIEEVAAEANGEIDLGATMRTEFDQMVRKTRLLEMERRLKEVLVEIEAVPERRSKPSA